METTIIANSYKLGLKENSESNMPMEKETGKREAREEGADGADGVDGVEEAEEEEAGDEAVEEEVEVVGEGCLLTAAYAHQHGVMGFTLFYRL